MDVIQDHAYVYFDGYNMHDEYVFKMNVTYIMHMHL